MAGLYCDLYTDNEYMNVLERCGVIVRDQDSRLVATASTYRPDCAIGGFRIPKRAFCFVQGTPICNESSHSLITGLGT